MSDAAGQTKVLHPAASGLGAAFARPQAMAAGCVIVLAVLGWFYIGLALRSEPAFAALCGTLGAEWSLSGLAFAVLMWAAMAFAMMLPSAGPMILTYAEIADTATRKGQRIVSPLVLTSGYGAVWIGFAVAAALAQATFTRLTLLDARLVSASAFFSGAIFVAAGVYQFSSLKHACLRQCQRPFPFFFAHWQTTARGVFRLGLQQGLFCLGCCWAMMLVMFAVGAMNVVWMAGLGILMTVEKMLSGPRFSQAAGMVLIGCGIAIVALAASGHWPVGAI